MSWEKTITVALWSLLILQFFLISLSNLTLIEGNLDCDTGKLFSHIVKMWEHKSLIIPEWAYTTTLEWDCTTLFSLLFYGITGDVFLSSGLSNILLYLMFALIIFYIFDDKEVRYALLALNIISIPYSIGMLDYYNMMFFSGTQYIIKVLLPLMLVGVFLHMERYHTLSKNEKCVLYGVTGLFLFLLFLSSASSGIYVAACGIVPLWIMYAVYKFFRWEKISFSHIALCVISMVTILTGILINNHLMGGARGQSMVIANVYSLLANVTSCFWGIFELMGAATTMETLPVLSLQGIILLLKLALTLFILGSGIYALYICMKKRGDFRLLLLLALPVWNYFVLNITYTRAGSPTYEYRYHLIGMIPLMCVASVMMWKNLEKCNTGQKWILSLFLFSLLLMVNIAAYGNLFTREEQNSELKELTSYCSTLDTEIVYLYDGTNDSDICRALDDSVPYICLLDNGITWTYDYYQKYVNAPMQTKNMIIVIDSSRTLWEDNHVFNGIEIECFNTIGKRKLYREKE